MAKALGNPGFVLPAGRTLVTIQTDPPEYGGIHLLALDEFQKQQVERYAQGAPGGRFEAAVEGSLYTLGRTTVVVVERMIPPPGVARVL